MRPVQLAMILCAAILSRGSSVSAQVFGVDENIHTIQDIEGTEMCLAHKTTLHFFFLGIYVSDDGYVLAPKGTYNEYIPLTDNEIREMQNEGSLPNPLPKYSIPVFEYIFGYSLWILIGGMIALAGIGRLLRHLSGAHRIKGLLANPHYQEAIKIALNADGNINEAVDYLHANGIPLTQAQTNMQLLLSKGATISM